MPVEFLKRAERGEEHEPVARSKRACTMNRSLDTSSGSGKGAVIDEPHLFAISCLTTPL